jgi:hypothetical protein
LLAWYVENPETYYEGQESFIAELRNVKRDKDARKERWYSIRFEEQWNVSCFIRLLVIISISGVGTAVVLIWRRSWEAGTNFMGAYFALSGFVLSEHVYITSREG